MHYRALAERANGSLPANVVGHRKNVPQYNFRSLNGKRDTSKRGKLALPPEAVE